MFAESTDWKQRLAVGSHGHFSAARVLPPWLSRDPLAI